MAHLRVAMICASTLMPETLLLCGKKNEALKVWLALPFLLPLILLIEFNAVSIHSNKSFV